MTRGRKVMYLNPDGFDAYDQLFADMAVTYKSPETEVTVASLTPDYGNFIHFEYRTCESIVMRGIVHAARADSKENFDGMIIGCFYDTALHDAREISGNMAVIGPCVTSGETGGSLSIRIGIIVGRQKWVNQMSATVRERGKAFVYYAFANGALRPTIDRVFPMNSYVDAWRYMKGGATV